METKETTSLVPVELEEALEEEDEHLSFLRRNVHIRHILTFMGFLGFTILNMLKVNMSVAIVCMVNWKELNTTELNTTELNTTDTYVIEYLDSTGNLSQYLNSTEDDNTTDPTTATAPAKNFSYADWTCSFAENVTVRSDDEDGPYAITTEMQGHILAGYFYGLLVTQYAGVLIAEKLSSKYLLLCGILISSLCTVATPFIADSIGFYLIIIQIIKGIGMGVIIPALSVLMGKWIPLSERFYAMCLVGSGIPFGGFLGTYLSGVICNAKNYGWPYIFYIFSGVGFVWSLIWLIMIFESPLTHPYITHHEMIRILENQAILPLSRKTSVPYSYIFKSGPVWAYIVVGFVSFWVLSIYTTLIPIFMSTILKFGIEMNGVWSSLPYLVEMVAYLFCCVLNDRLMKVGRVRTTKIHKWSICIGLFAFAVHMLAIPFTGCLRVLTVVMLVIALGYFGLIFASTSYIPLCLSPRYSGSISGIMNTLGAITGIIAPTMMGYLTMKHRTLYEWQILFFLTAALGLLALIIFAIFGSSSLQEWDDPAFRGESDLEEELVVEVDQTPEGKLEVTLQDPEKL
ncbi:sialin-like [Parasteatoda tepidariorum]|uniref:sialin-like n=1 Tax=Parasteatoda tepidariorum TaxID=114398 RepID=UPI001C726FC0|nr:sialin-like [Parasteatoda tepidariorum]